ncbi:MAG TPA: TRAP transporter TatT component family protein, partial [Zoogloea sp.]|nr:TRAP transporter TatT component family protein [Zoogloea sp.]
MASPEAPPALRLHPSRVLARIVLLPLLALGLCACTPRQLVLDELANSLASQGQSAEDDPDLARDAAPFYLKLSESVLREQPGHLPLAGAVAGGFTQYAYAFVALQADRLDPTHPRTAAPPSTRASPP